MTSAQFVETSVTNNSSFQNNPRPDDHVRQTTETPGIKPFTTLTYCNPIFSDIDSFPTSSDFGLWTKDVFAKVISRYNAKRRRMSMLTPCSSISYTKRQNIIFFRFSNNKSYETLINIKYKPW